MASEKGKEIHRKVMIFMGFFTVASALAGGYLAFSEGGLPSLMYGRLGRTPPPEPAPTRVRPALVSWRPWTPEAFAAARASGKPVLLSLEAFWCGPCDRMQNEVYSDPSVASWIRANAIPVRVDAEERPDLAELYLSGGWPATAFLLDSGEVLAEATFLPSSQFLAWAGLVKASWDHRREALSESARARWAERRRSVKKVRFDAAGPQFPFLDRSPDRLKAALALEDPVWGGFFRYAKGPGWKHPSHEKVLADQAAAVERYQGEPAARTLRYVERFLSAPDGGYYASQKGELRAGGKIIPGELYFPKSEGDRRALGVPEVDRRIFIEESRRMARAVLKNPAATPAQRAFAEKTLKRLEKAGKGKRKLP